MNTPFSQARRSDDFDELLWQITGELAMTPASASLTAAPFIDLEPDPEPATPSPRAERPAEPAASRPAILRVPRFVLATAAAVVLSFGAFMAGATSNEPAVMTAMELHDAPEHSAVLAVAHGPSTQIPMAQVAPAPEPAPVALAAEPEPETKAKPKRKSKRKYKAKPKPKPSVAFEDL